MKLIPLASILIFSSIYIPSVSAENFETCVKRLQVTAKEQGLSQDIIDNTLAKVKYVPRVVELDNQQPEFSQTFEGYYNRRVTEARVVQGRRLLKENRAFLEQLTKKYGVPAQYLLAFWGLETNFGGYKGKMPVLDSLATLACLPRRSKYFTGELMQALKLKQKYGFSSDDMVGSWAGAMGHTQFMPSAYAQYAIDADGSGKADLWNSQEDALTSAAYFLQQLGWNRNERWGREVILPRGFSYQNTGKAQIKPLTDWSALGLLNTNRTPLSTPDLQASLYLPSGHTGPAFLAYENFDVIMRWNRSTFYAIAVGRLANRINGGGVLTVKPPEMPRLSREKLKALQESLNEKGFEVGEADGILGSRSIIGLQAYQKSQGLIADGYPSVATFQSLGLSI
ncbi:lytic murein transglycosylase [Shewanella surugensis]|uniref:Lytic murein transglycosylase n=1 Tax=Shewanella surugensis TaxID=212020 RepID=A0ABT0LF71_9GAMM|nr:lytic murein transglycosylase [Shewanella surugensis]MCL1126362.1 lytic murein transglycosylase [Shewanella surugensis]